VQVLRSRLENRQIRSARERILQFLRLRCDPEGMWRREGSLKHLAEEIGLTHEALYRALAALEHEGRITRTSEGIHVQPAAAKTGDRVRTQDGRTSAA
jgi:DNA-binding IclR family transcriptional regulator